jgi:hypothetical protein
MPFAGVLSRYFCCVGSGGDGKRRRSGNLQWTSASEMSVLLELVGISTGRNDMCDGRAKPPKRILNRLAALAPAMLAASTSPAGHRKA